MKKEGRVGCVDKCCRAAQEKSDLSRIDRRYKIWATPSTHYTNCGVERGTIAYKATVIP